MSFADRYVMLTERTGDKPDPDDASQVLAMPVVLRIEKVAPPSRVALLTVAARAAVSACLDDRVDDEWHEPMRAWCDARIRKISRRARGGQWAAAQDVAGVTVTGDGASARALVPGPVGGLDKRISRLQIGGTDVDGAIPTRTGTDAEVVLAINPHLDMSVGKLAAQLGHGSMLALNLFSREDAFEWAQMGFPLSVIAPSASTWDAWQSASDTIAVADAGFTEVAPGSVTVLARRPGPIE